MFQDFDVFWEKDVDKQYCPKMTYIDDSEKIFDLVDWNNKMENINSEGEAMVVLGYYRQEKPESPVKFHRCFTISSKTHKSVYLQHHTNNGYDLIIFRADTDAKGGALAELDDQCLVCIKVDGAINETMVKSDDMSPETRRMFRELVHDMSIPINGELRVFSVKMKKKKQKKSRVSLSRD